MLACIFFPEISISLSAQTKENAADLLKDKYNEIIRFYPMLKNEIEKANFAKGDALIVYKNGARLDNLANSQTSKGQRRKRINMEESALIDNDTFLDALLPIVEVPRVCVGKYSITDPEELNQQINFFTTAGFKGSDEYQRSVDMVKDMVNLKGKIVLGSSFWLPCWFGRGSTKSQIFQKKRDMTMISFAQNYESEWVGASSGALVNINKLMNCRSLTKPVLSSTNKDDEFYIGVDVARSQNTSNNQSFISVVKVNRTNDKSKIVSMDLVNLVNIPNILNADSVSCDNGFCVVTSCKPDSNTHVYNPSNGHGQCEANSKDHCGSHDYKCNDANATNISCQNGFCKIEDCNGDYHVCTQKEGVNNGHDICHKNETNECGKSHENCSSFFDDPQCINGVCSGSSCIGEKDGYTKCEKGNEALCLKKEGSWTGNSWPDDCSNCVGASNCSNGKSCKRSWTYGSHSYSCE